MRSFIRLSILAGLLVPMLASAQTQTLPQGWSMVGNDTGAAINASAVFGNAISPTAVSPSVTTVWTWNNALSQWSFYAPSMTSEGLSTYAAAKGYSVLSSIAKGEGFWVNSKNQFLYDPSVTAVVTNVAPVANAGVAQTVVAGSVVSLDGSASSDANNDAMTYAWTLTSEPAGSTTALSLATSSKPTFVADMAGTYMASLTVNDGKVNSTAATVTIIVVDDIPPVPVGTGILAADMFSGYFFKIDEITGVMTKLPFVCGMMTGGDIAPDGRVIVNTLNKTVNVVDPIGGKCGVLFNVPEIMWGLAVAPDGTIVTISEYTTFGQYQIYTYLRDGTLLSKAAIQSGIVGVRAPIDFAPDGTLVSGGYKLDPATGNVSESPYKCDSGGMEMDISASGYMRAINSNFLSVYDCSTGQIIRQTVVQYQFRGIGPIVYR